MYTDMFVRLRSFPRSSIITMSDGVCHWRTIFAMMIRPI